VHLLTDNLKALVEFKSSDSVLKIKCQLNNVDRINAIKELHRMNINRESLFPGRWFCTINGASALVVSAFH
jgi:hypothetical protein